MQFAIKLNNSTITYIKSSSTAQLIFHNSIIPFRFELHHRKKWRFPKPKKSLIQPPSSSSGPLSLTLAVNCYTYTHTHTHARVYALNWARCNCIRLSRNWNWWRIFWLLVLRLKIRDSVCGMWTCFLIETSFFSVDLWRSYCAWICIWIERGLTVFDYLRIEIDGEFRLLVLLLRIWGIVFGAVYVSIHDDVCYVMRRIMLIGF